MKECKECGGTGLVVNDKYCKCIDGKLLKQQHGVNELVKKANKKLAEREQQEEKKISKIEKLIDEQAARYKQENERVRRIPLIVGDWVEFQGRPGIVKTIDEHNNSFWLEVPKPYRGEWITYTNQKPMPLEQFNDPATLRQLVDMALLFKDENWFNELTRREKKW